MMKLAWSAWNIAIFILLVVGIVAVAIVFYRPSLMLHQNFILGFKLVGYLTPALFTLAVAVSYLNTLFAKNDL